jgi:hypothetical protein
MTSKPQCRKRRYYQGALYQKTTDSLTKILTAMHKEGALTFDAIIALFDPSYRRHIYHVLSIGRQRGFIVVQHNLDDMRFSHYQITPAGIKYLK